MRLSWQGFVFDRYKRIRAARCGRDFDAIRVPCRPGLASVVIPVYNGEYYVREAIDSILAQSYANFELLVVDDGSVDSTPTVLAEYGGRDPRVRVLRQQNQKLPRALSNGFRHATGEFLTWVSADNRLKPNFLERMVACLQRHPNWDMIYANQDIIGAEGHPLRNSDLLAHRQQPKGSEHLHLPDDPSRLNTWPDNYVGAAFLYRARALHLMGDYSRFRFGVEDYDYWMRINDFMNLRHSDFPEPVYEYRFHETSLTSRAKELQITQRRDRLMIFDDFRRDFALSPAVWLVDVHASGDRARKAADEIRGWIETTGGRCMTSTMDLPEEWPRFWCPLVYVRIADEPASIGGPPDHLPRSACKVLVCSKEAPLPAEVPDEWDLCAAWSRIPQPPCLDKFRQGWLVSKDLRQLCSAIDVRARSDHLALVEAEMEAPPDAACRFSVILCASSADEPFQRTLQSVLRQTVPGTDYEILVAGKDPEDDQLRMFVERMYGEIAAEDARQIRYVHSPFPDLSHAQNAGVAEACGRIVCFLDHGAIAQPDWLEQTGAVYAEDPNVGVVGGRLLPDNSQSEPTWIDDEWLSLWGYFSPDCEQSMEVEHWREFPRRGNWTALRETYLAVGGFRTNLGSRTEAVGGGVERIAATLACRLGWKVAIAPDSIVRKEIEPARCTLHNLWTAVMAEARLIYAAQRQQYIAEKPSAVKCCRRIAQAAAGLLFHPLDGWRRQSRKLATIAAEVSVLMRYFRDHTQRRLCPVALRD